jgi:arylsulfatase A-like enzyme
VRSPDLAHAIDLFPTIAKVAGIAAPKDLPGINLLDETARKERDTVFGVAHSVHNMTPGDPSGTLQYLWCVSGDWKLLLRQYGSDTTEYKNVHIWDEQPVRLYNLKDDPHEKNELSATHPDIVNELRKKIEAWHPIGKK